MNQYTKSVHNTLTIFSEYQVYRLLQLQIFVIFTYFIFSFLHESLYGLFLTINKLIALYFLFMIFYTFNKKSIFNYFVLYILFIIMPYMFVSNYLNNGSFVSLFKAYHDYFVFIPSLIVLYMYLNETSIFKLLNFLRQMLIMQFIIVCLQLPYHMLTKGANFHSDLIKGTFWSANDLGYTIILFLSLLISFKLHQRHLFSKQKDAILIGMIFFIIFAAESRGALVAIVLSVIVGIFFIKAIRQYIMKNLFRIIFLFGTLLTLYSLTMNVSLLNNNFISIFNITKVIESEEDSGGGSNRLLWFPLTYKHLEQYAFSPLVGMGPSTHSSLGAVALKAPIYTTEVYNAFNELSKGLDSSVDSQIIPIWAEYGYLGLIVFFGFYSYIAMKYLRLFSKSPYINIKIYSLTIFMMTLQYIMLSYANHNWESPTNSLVYFLLLGVCLKMIKIEKENIRNE